MPLIATRTESPIETLADLLARLGGVPLERIRFHPYPGTAVEADVLARPDGEKRLCELVEGVLVEKPMGYYESRLAAVLIQVLGYYVEARDLGIVLGADATLRLAPHLVRLPDVCFISWRHFPNRELPAEPMPDLAPDLAVEILSRSNTEAEMARKRREYFDAGTTLVWIVDPPTRTARVYTRTEESVHVPVDGALDGGDVLPGFQFSLQEWFDRAGHQRGA